MPPDQPVDRIVQKTLLTCSPETTILEAARSMAESRCSSIVVVRDGKPVGINPPATVDLEVIDTEPSMKGATASASYKPAKLETGVTVQVPPFVQVGDKVRVDPSDGSYLERVK